MLQWPVVVKETHVGRGVFAGRTISPDEEIGRIEGKLFDDPNHDSTYAIGIDDTYSIEPYAPFRFLNHSCEPNCELVIYDDADEFPNGVPDVYVVAIKEIPPGAELSIDYGWPATSAIPCQCKAPRCRGWIVDSDELALIPPTPSPQIPTDKPLTPVPILEPVINRPLHLAESQCVVMPPMSISIGPETNPANAKPKIKTPISNAASPLTLKIDHLKWVINAD